MLLVQGLREYARSSPWPEVDKILIKLKDDISVTLDIPSFGVANCANDSTDGNVKSSSLRVALAHAAFKTAMQPNIAPDDAFFKRCTAEVNAINLFFPDIEEESLRIAFAAWLAFACVADDILEQVDLDDREIVLAECIQLLKCEDSSFASVAFKAKDQRVQGLTRALYNHCHGYLAKKSAQAYFEAVCVVLQAHIEECHFLQGRQADSLPAYLSIRKRTISLGPFFETVKTHYLTEKDLEFDHAWKLLQDEVGCVAGLQNDLIGLARDLAKGEELNAVMVLMRGFRSKNKGKPNHDILSRCVTLVNAEHNRSVARCIAYMTQLHRAAEASDTSSIERVEAVARHILMMAETHLRWCSSSKRYKLEVAINGSFVKQVAQDSSEQAPEDKSPQDDAPHPDSNSSCNPTPRTQSISGPSTSSQELTIQSKGMFHGLPTFSDTPDCSGLTAIVAGATGLSGYHMVKVLAASPQRWKKIYCLSSRAPPENFFSDLGDGANRVEHLAVDFFKADPAEIAEQLKKAIKHVDHIFYFSYMQPGPKGDDASDLWANAEELANVNVTMFNNFLSALQQAQLNPRRFMLQTGTKHYGFYLGPATVPALESDPRVTIDRNFYYEQEDALSFYCQSVGTAWNVSRPSYIVGAVRDGTLNHLLGFGIYAAVQAHLGQPIKFPGDYSAWDREQVQSTGLLNSYFAEWLVLTEKTANEAFNIHDGLCFTWGRLWPSLAKWFGVEWCPPEEDESKYSTMKLPGPATPRGHGPQTTLRSTTPLLTRSLQPETASAWSELTAKHNLVLNPFASDASRTRIFAFSDSAVIGDAPMTTSLRKARAHGFFGTVDSYEAVFAALREMGRLRLIPEMLVGEFSEA